MTADRGMQAVGADQDVAALRADGAAAVRPGEMRGDAALVLLEADQAVTRQDVVVAETRTGFLEQRDLQRAAVDRVLRPAVAARGAARLTPDALAMAVVEGEFLDRPADRRDLAGQAELGQFAHRVGLEIDAEPQGIDPARRLEHDGFDSRFEEAERGREPADATADDDDLHRFPTQKSPRTRRPLQYD